MRRRILAGAAASAAVLVGAAACDPEPPPTQSPDILENVQDIPNGSSDGRYHTCGYVTEDGVTEYLDVYLERCGDATYGSDSVLPETG